MFPGIKQRGTSAAIVNTESVDSVPGYLVMNPSIKIIMLYIKNGGSSGLYSLVKLRQLVPSLPILVMVDKVSASDGRLSIHLGAAVYTQKDNDSTIELAIETAEEA